MPTETQILGAKIMVAREAYEAKHRKPYMGKPSNGWIYPPRENVYRHLSKLFGLMPRTLSYFMTYSRSCEHPWSKGACDKCPAWDHFPLR